MRNGSFVVSAPRDDTHRRLAIGLFVLTFVSYAYFFGGGGWNQNANFDLTRALVERHTFAIDAYAHNTGDVSGYRDHDFVRRRATQRHREVRRGGFAIRDFAARVSSALLRQPAAHSTRGDDLEFPDSRRAPRIPERAAVRCVDRDSRFSLSRPLLPLARARSRPRRRGDHDSQSHPAA